MEGSRLSFSLCLVLNLSVTAFSSLEFSRYDFPTDFIFGAGTSAYQVCLFFTCICITLTEEEMIEEKNLNPRRELMNDFIIIIM